MVLQQSFTLTDCLTNAHQHEWEFMQESPYYQFGTKWGGCALGGGGRRNKFAKDYEGLPDFREFIPGKINSRLITKEQILQLLTMPRHLTDAQNDDSHLKELLKTTRELTDEFCR